MTGKEVLIREASEEDHHAITDLYVQLKEHHTLLAPRNPRYHVERDGWDQAVTKALEDEATDILVAEVQGAVAGFVKVTLVDKPWGVAGEIDTLVVDESLRRRGIGTLLLDAGERSALTRGAVGLRLDVLAVNEPARRFYERASYKPFAVRFGKDLPGAG